MLNKNITKFFAITLFITIIGAVFFAHITHAQDIKEIKSEKKVASFATMKLSKLQENLNAFRIDTHTALLGKKSEFVSKKANPDPKYQTKLAQIKYALFILLFTFLVYLFNTLMIFYIALGVAIVLVFSFIWRNLL